MLLLHGSLHETGTQLELEGKRWAQLSLESGRTCNDVLASLLDGADNHRVTLGQPLQPCSSMCQVWTSCAKAFAPGMHLL